MSEGCRLIPGRSHHSDSRKLDPGVYVWLTFISKFILTLAIYSVKSKICICSSFLLITLGLSEPCHCYRKKVYVQNLVTGSFWLQECRVIHNKNFVSEKTVLSKVLLNLEVLSHYVFFQMSSLENKYFNSEWFLKVSLG